MRNLEELTTDITRTTEVANKNLNDFPQDVWGSWGTAIEQAKSKLKDLRAEYKSTLLANGVAIFVEGDKSKAADFAKLVVGEGEGIAVSATALYDRLAEAVDMSISPQRLWGVHQTYRLHVELQQVMHDVGLKEIPMPSKSEDLVLKTYADVLDHIRKIVRDANGDILNKLYVEKLVCDEALKIRYMGNIVPVLVLNAKPEEILGIAASFGKGNANVTIGTDTNVDKEFMVKTFKDVNKKIRKK